MAGETKTVSFAEIVDGQFVDVDVDTYRLDPITLAKLSLSAVYFIRDREFPAPKEVGWDYALTQEETMARYIAEKTGVSLVLSDELIPEESAMVATELLKLAASTGDI